MIQTLNITSSCVICSNTVYKDGVEIFENKQADVSKFLLSVYKHLGVSYPKFYKMDNLCKLGFLASEILLGKANISEKYSPFDIGVVLCNAQSSLDNDCRYYSSMKENASPALFVYTLPNILIGEICIRNRIKGENAFFVFEKFTAEFVEKYVENLFINDNLQACICGWVDLLDEDYKAVLYYIEKKESAAALSFTLKNINKIYQTENG